MEKRLLIAAVLSLAVLLLWDRFVPKPASPRPVSTPAASPVAITPASSESEGASSASSGSTGAPAQAPGPPESASAQSDVALGNELFHASFSNRGAVLDSFVLTRYFDEQNRPLELIRSTPPGLPRPLTVDFPKDAALTKRVSEALFVVERESDRIVRFRYADASVAVTKEIRIGAGYDFDVKVTVAGPPYALLVGPGLRNPGESEPVSRYVLPPSAVGATSEGLKRLRPEKAVATSWSVPPRGFVGIEDNYFLTVLIPRAATTASVLTIPVPHAEGKPAVELATAVSGQGTLDCEAFFGPKDLSILKSYGIGLERTVDFGWYGILAGPLLFLLKKAYTWVHNWGLSILAVTLIIRVLLFPLTAKSYVSMKRMQKLAPKMNAIRDKYKKARSDAAQRQKMNTELMALYQSEGYNPMSGCLPMLLQLPILIAFYNVLSHAIELRHAPFILGIKDLSAIDTSYVLVILMIVSMYVQQAMTPATMDPSQKKMMMFMPLLFGFMMKGVPSGLVLYWFFSNVLTIVQQVLMNRIVKEDPAPPPGNKKALKQARA